MTDNNPAESAFDADGEDIREQLLQGADDAGPSTQDFEAAPEPEGLEAGIAALQPRGTSPDRPEVDPGPSDDKILAEEGFDRDAETWLSENFDLLEGKLVQPETEADVRANARLVKEARARAEAEERADRLEEDQTLREIQAVVEELLESGEDEHEIAEALREQRPEALGPFLENWAGYDPEAAQAYYFDVVADAAAEGIERDRRVRERAAKESEAEIALAFDAVMEKANLTEHGQELVREIVGLSPGSLASIESAAQAAERANELIRGAGEVQRAAQEQAIKQEIVDASNATDMDLGWGDAQAAPSIEAKMREAAVFRPASARKTVGAVKREILDGGLSEGLQSFVARHPRAPSPNSLDALKRGR